MTYIMDGGTHNDPFNNLNLPTPFPDALQEFKVETSALPARYGHHAASAVNLVTKSGTNTVHGNVFEFIRDYHFNARNFFAPTRDSLKRNQFGGTFGGPVIKDKLFFFGGYQGRIEKSNPPETVSFVPTAAMLAGDFTAFTSPSCNGRQITLSPAAGSSTTRISPSAFSPIAMKFLQHVPGIDGPLRPPPVRHSNNNTEHQTLARADYTLSTDHTVLRALPVRASTTIRRPTTATNVLTLSRTGQNNQVALARGRPQLDAVRHGVERAARHVQPHASTTGRCRVLLAVGSRGQRLQPSARLHGRHVTGNGFNIGTGATNPGYFNSDSFQIADDIDFVRGQHQLSFGGNWIHTKIETLNNRPTNGAVHVQRTGDGARRSPTSCSDVCSNFLQGNPVYDFDDNDYVGALRAGRMEVCGRTSR